MNKKLSSAIANIFILFFLALLVSRNSLSTENFHQNFRLITRTYEYNFFDWTLKAIFDKIIIRSSNIADYFDKDTKKDLVYDLIENITKSNTLVNNINSIYSNPEIQDPETETINLNLELDEVKEKIRKLSPIFESIIEDQVIYSLERSQIVRFNQPFPPLIFQIGYLPNNIVVSPRDVIFQIDSISLYSNLGVEKYVEIENEVTSKLNVSSLVVPIGGLGSYPTMVGLSSSLPWLVNTVTHEWIHNWLFFRPLGINYGRTNETRTMNETTASIVGSEIGLLVIKEFYPQIFIDEFIEDPIPEVYSLAIIKPQININMEMYKTRIHVDSLLSEGRIDEAESYMESRRVLFWDYGYQIRKINQAYFAFYGAYADIPGGPAGVDPIGPAVREFREKSVSLKSFLFSIAQMSSSNDLFEVIKSANYDGQ